MKYRFGVMHVETVPSMVVDELQAERYFVKQ